MRHDLPRHRSPTPAVRRARLPGKRELLARVCGGRLASLALGQLFRNPGIVCITHHRIADRVVHDPDVISATPNQLREQADWVRRTLTVLNGDETADAVTGRSPVRGPSVAFTFDDAYEDNYEAGRMLMQEFGIAATFFVPTAFIETGVVPPWDRLGFAAQHAEGTSLRVPAIDRHGPWTFDLHDYGTAITALMSAYSGLPTHLRPTFVKACETSAGADVDDGPVRSPFMTWRQIRALRDMGHTIGAHTHTHPILASLCPEEQAREIQVSKQILEERLGCSIDVFAYPYGKPGRSFTDVTKRIVAECGFRAAFSFYGGWNRPHGCDPYDVRRIKVDPGTSMPMFRTRIVTRGLVPV